MEIVEGRAVIGDLDAFLAELREIGVEHDCVVQALDASYVVGRDHLERALELANRAFERGENVADDRGIELLLYAAGRRQIDDALELGVSEGEQEIVVVIDAERSITDDGAESGEAAAASAVAGLLEPAETLSADRIDRERVLDYFGVTDAELAATDADLSELVGERSALLAVNK